MAATQASLSTGASFSLQGASLAQHRSSQAPSESCANCGCSPTLLRRRRHPACPPHPQFRPALHAAFSTKVHSSKTPSKLRRACVVKAAKQDENVPTWAKPGSEEVPPWAKEDKSGYQKEGPKDLPFGLYLLFSVFTAIAAVGSIYEYANKNPVFGVIPADSGLYAPILGFFVLTGFPTAGFLLYKAISSANKLAEEMDKEDGVNKDY